MKIWHISDTHGYHNLLNVPEVDMVIHSGDCSNKRDSLANLKEVTSFIRWFYQLDIKHKIFVAGNHDSSIEANLIIEEDFNINGINYLFNSTVEIEGYKIWGSPFTPTYNNWSFMKARKNMQDIWNLIPNDTDIIVTHGPPKGILDLTVKRNNSLEQCGCNNLRKKVLSLEPKLHTFGHIHNYKEIANNAGTMKLSDYKTIFSNGTVVYDHQFGKIFNSGNIIKLNT